MKYLKPKMFNWSNDTFYLLGKKADGTKVFLQKPTFDCGWYWGGLYLESFTNNNCPERSFDIAEHTHLDTQVLNKGATVEALDAYLSETVLEDRSAKYKFLELARTFYTLETAARLYLKGNMNIAENSCYSKIKHDDWYEEIVKVQIPAVLSELIALLGWAESPQSFTDTVHIKY